jgi:hypothetical protein
MEPAPMRQSLTLHYTPNQQDYASVLRIFNWRRTSTKISLAFLALASILIFYAILSRDATLTFFELLWLLFPPLLVMFTFFLQPWRTARKAAQNAQLVADATWLVDEAGIHISSAYGSIFLEWESLSKLVKTREYYLLLSKINKNSFRFLPRRAFTSQQDNDLFLQLVSQHISPA